MNTFSQSNFILLNYAGISHIIYILYFWKTAWSLCPIIMQSKILWELLYYYYKKFKKCLKCVPRSLKNFISCFFWGELISKGYWIFNWEEKILFSSTSFLSAWESPYILVLFFWVLSKYSLPFLWEKNLLSQIRNHSQSGTGWILSLCFSVSSYFLQK